MKPLSPVLSSIACIALAHVPTAAAELSSAEVYARTAPAIGTVELLDADGAQFDLHSAVLVAQNRFVTVCDGLAGAASLKLSLVSGRYDANLRSQDLKRNLCVISTSDSVAAGAPLEVRQGAPRPGLRVFAISNALGLGVGISDGLVAGIRTFSGASYLQFSAPVSPGSQGGAVVDEDGRLLGVIEYRHHGGQNVNFAAPAAWIDEIEARAAADGAENERNEVAAMLARDRSWVELHLFAKEWSSMAPDSPRAWRFAAQAAENIGDTAQAVLAWQTLQRVDPDSNQGGIGLGTSLLKQGRVQEAVSLVETLIARDRQDASIWLLYGQALRAAHRAGDAEVAYRRATELDPWLLYAYGGLAGLAHERGDFPAAAAIWTKLSGLYPDNPGFRYELVRSQLQAGQAERAYRSLARLPETETESAAALYWKGMTLRKLGRPLDAVAAFRRSIAAAPPGNAQTWIALSTALSELRRYSEAIDAAQNAVKTEPDNPEAKFWLAVQLKDGGRVAEALAVTTELVSSHPSDAAAWRQHGFALSILTKWKEAIPALEKSLELDPKQGKVWAALVETYHSAGQQAAARRAYEQLRTVDPAYARNTYSRLIVTYEEPAP